jgi:hypothetical protein
LETIKAITDLFEGQPLSSSDFEIYIDEFTHTVTDGSKTIYDLPVHFVDAETHPEIDTLIRNRYFLSIEMGLRSYQKIICQ